MIKLSMNYSFVCLDELDDITFSQSMRIIIDALMDAVMEYFHITKSQLEEFTSNFIQRLLNTCSRHWNTNNKLLER